MKHVVYAKNSLLVDDASADALLEYAVALADIGGADRVNLKAVGDDGDEVEVTILLNAATDLIVESASPGLDIVTNSEAVADMRRRTALIRTPPPVSPMMPDYAAEDFDELR